MCVLESSSSVGLKCVRTSRMDSFLNLSPLYTHVSRKVINRAAMGRARFLLCTGFSFFLTARPWAERGSWFTRGFLTARPWAERGSCSARGLFYLLTARPWAERGSCSARGLFFIFFFFVMSES